MAEHYFVIVGNNFRGGVRMCGECDRGYDDGDHIEITDLKPYTSYVCPSGGGLGHSSRWTGAYHKDGRQLRLKFCICGAELVAEDAETWRLSWEMGTDYGEWRPVAREGSKHSTHLQHGGLLDLIAQGEPIRNVKLEAVSRG